MQGMTEGGEGREDTGFSSAECPPCLAPSTELGSMTVDCWDACMQAHCAVLFLLPLCHG